MTKRTQTTKRHTSVKDLPKKNRDLTNEEQKQVKGGSSAQGNPINSAKGTAILNAEGDPVFGKQPQ